MVVYDSVAGRASTGHRLDMVAHGHEPGPVWDESARGGAVFVDGEPSKRVGSSGL
jgi:hypothetical protein